jgi:hypothetical protein
MTSSEVAIHDIHEIITPIVQEMALGADRSETVTLSTNELISLVLIELKKMNLNLAIFTGNEVTDADLS